MRWIEPFPLPGVGCSLTVDVPLPANPGSEPRLMRCAATVVRIVRQESGQPSVGLRIDSVRFVEPKAPAGAYPLQSMPAANDRIV